MPGTVRVARRSRPWDRLPIVKARPKGQAAYRPAGKLTLSAREKRLADLLAEAARMYPSDVWSSPLTSADLLEADRATRAVLDGLQRRIAGVLADQYEAAAEFAARELAGLLSREFRRVGKSVRKAAPDPADLVAGFSFDARNANTAAWARDRSARLVTNMTATQRDTIRQVVNQAFELQRTPQQAARSLYEVLNTTAPTSTVAQQFTATFGTNMNGLTARYEQAVVNRAEKLAADLADRGITGTKALERIKKDSDKYAEQLRRARSRTIARTEILTANNAGRMASFEQAQQRGLLSEEHSRKRWSASGFDMCPICTSLDGQLQRLKDPFVDEVSVDYPPAHPNCRCSFDIEPNVELWTPPDIVGQGTVDDPHRWATDPQPTPRGRDASQRPLPSRPPTPPPAGPPTATPVTPRIGPPQTEQVSIPRTRRTAAQIRDQYLADAIPHAQKYGVTPEDVLQFIDEVPALRQRARAEAAQQAYEVHGILDRTNLGSFGIRDPRDTDAAARVYYDWFRNLHPQEQVRLRQNGWVVRGGGQQADQMDEALAALFNLESRGLPGQALEEHWLRLNRDYDILRQAVRGRRPANYNRYGGTPDYDRLLPVLRSEGYDVNVIIGGSDVETAAMMAGQTLRQGTDEALRLLQEADMAVHGPPPWRMGFQSWEEEVRDLEYAVQEGLATRTQVERLRELVPSRVDDGQDYEELYATIIQIARYGRLDVADYAVIPWA